jgi:hypothetical protein
MSPTLLDVNVAIILAIATLPTNGFAHQDDMALLPRCLR